MNYLNFKIKLHFICLLICLGYILSLCFLRSMIEIVKITGETDYKVRSFFFAYDAYFAKKGVNLGTTDLVIVITFYSPSCLSQETVNAPFVLRVKLPPAYLSTTPSKGFSLREKERDLFHQFSIDKKTNKKESKKQLHRLKKTQSK